MLAYYRFHPDFVKEAGRVGQIQTHLSNFWQNNVRSLKSKLNAIKNPANLKQFAKDNKWNIGAGTAAVGMGVYFGNQAYNNALPPVRQLPDMYNPGYMEAFDQQQFFFDPASQNRGY